MLIKAAIAVAALCLLVSGLTRPAFAEAQSPGGLDAVFYPTNSQLEVFYVDNQGNVRDVWKANSGHWEQPVTLADRAAPPSGHVSAVYQVQDEHLEVFWVNPAGAIQLVYKDHNKKWNPPGTITGPGFLPPGAPLSVVWPPKMHELQVFGIGGDGALKIIWKKDDGKWTVGPPMTGPGFGVAGSQLSAVYQPIHDHLEVLAIGPTGAINDEWKSGDGPWSTGPLTGPGVAPSGAAISAAWQPTDQNLEAYFIGSDGALYRFWKHNDGAWTLARASDGDIAPAGAPVSAAYMSPDNGHLETYTIGKDGAVKYFWEQNDGRQYPFVSSTSPGAAPVGGTLKAAVQQAPVEQIEVFYQDTQGQIWDSWRVGTEPWNPPLRLTNPNGATPVDQAFCNAFFAEIYHGNMPDIWREHNCAPFVSRACDNWRMTGSLTLWTDFIDEGGYILITNRATSAGGVVGPVDWFKGEEGNSRRGKYGFGQALSPPPNRFDPKTGRIMFNLRLDKVNDDPFQIQTYYGVVDTMLPMSSPGVGIAATYQHGSVWDTGGKSPAGTWYAPLHDGQELNPVVCSRKDFTFLPPPLPSGTPDPGVNFSGNWRTTVQNGAVYDMQLTQDPAGSVSGTYGAGTISSGRIIGRTLYANWSQDGAVGTLAFQLAPDNHTFAGAWTDLDGVVLPDNVRGAWDGYSTDFFDDKSQGDFNGTFSLDGAGAQQKLAFHKSGTSATGTYGSNGSVQGPVTYRTKGPATLAASVQISAPNPADALKGSGTFFLYPDGQGYSGYWHTGPLGLNAWSGTLVSLAKLPFDLGEPKAAKPPFSTTDLPGPAHSILPPPASVKLPSGQCPGSEAQARTLLPVSDGEEGLNLSPAIAAGTLVQCKACDASWCLIGDANPHATVRRGSLNFGFATATAPAPHSSQTPNVPRPTQPKSTAPTQPSPAPATANFQGTWPVRSDKDWSYQFSIGQSGNSAWGTFVDQNGTPGNLVNASVSGQVLSFQWTETGGYAGTAQFTMAPGNTSFQGDYTVSTYPAGTAANLLHGTWATYTPVKSAPSTALPPDYGACCAAPKDEIDVR